MSESLGKIHTAKEKEKRQNAKMPKCHSGVEPLRKNHHRNISRISNRPATRGSVRLFFDFVFDFDFDFDFAFSFQFCFFGSPTGLTACHWQKAVKCFEEFIVFVWGYSHRNLMLSRPFPHSAADMWPKLQLLAATAAVIGICVLASARVAHAAESTGSTTTLPLPLQPPAAPQNATTPTSQHNSDNSDDALTDTLEAVVSPSLLRDFDS